MQICIYLFAHFQCNYACILFQTATWSVCKSQQNCTAWFKICVPFDNWGAMCECHEDLQSFCCCLNNKMRNDCTFVIHHGFE